ncbi:NAD(P)-dependent alcohol dehydrogenase [Rhodococcus sp. NM-2]|uniref:Geraniol dehydrogenase n=1 Tax=Rhodococcus opacus TaxID=37919 RepID=A0A076EQY9_RHOOP|nr:NAD(P)-dependent alcohol dehydrogenase [Rhodococcus opacus]AII08455.1 geraniol dehydrogenase [Rhodococcus opacus]
MTIIAALAREPHSNFQFQQVSLAELRPDEILVEIRGVGICHTDIAARDGIYGLPYPIVLGHEGSGVVTTVGAGVTTVAPGDHVVVSFNSCGRCTSCTSGNPAYCRDFAVENYIGTRPDGSRALESEAGPVYSHFFGQSSFATHAVVNQRNVVAVDADLKLAQLGPLGCGLQTGAGAVMRSMRCHAGSSLIILGAGPVGLAAVMAARIQGCSPILVVEPHEARRTMATDMGATHTIDPTADGDLAEGVRRIVPGGVDYVFDTTGRVDVIRSAIAAVGCNAVLGLVGVPSDFSVDLPLNIVSTMQTGLTVKGIVEGDSDPSEFIPELIGHYRAGRFPFDKMITTFPLSAINEAVAAQHRGDVVKAVLVPDADLQDVV